MKSPPGDLVALLFLTVTIGGAGRLVFVAEIIAALGIAMAVIGAIRKRL